MNSNDNLPISLLTRWNGAAWRRLAGSACLLAFLVSLGLEFAMVPSVQAAPSACMQIPELRNYVAAYQRSDIFNSESVAERVALDDQRWSQAQLAAKVLFGSYRNGSWTQKRGLALGQCLASPQGKYFGNALEDSVFEMTLAKLQSSPGPAIQKFAAAIKNQGAPLYRVLSDSEFAGADGRMAGFHRGEQILFMDFSRIAESDWDVIFIHEFAHSLDLHLGAAVETFGDKALGKAVAQIGHSASHLSQLSAQDRAQLRTWLLAGLDRGFLAECRAWTISLSLYQEGLKSKTFTSVKWLDDILAQKRPNESVNSFTVRYLNPSFTNPTDGLFSLPVVQEELQALRLEITAKGFTP